MTELEQSIMCLLMQYESLYFRDFTDLDFSVECDNVDVDAPVFSSGCSPIAHNCACTLNVCIRDDMDCAGQYDSDTNSLSVDPKHCDDTHVLLHELIHAEEYALDRACAKNGFTFARDIVVFCLYQRLSRKHDNLDRFIAQRCAGNDFENIYEMGGTHSILFALKSLDIDDQLGLEPGTTFGYSFMLGAELEYVEGDAHNE